MDAPRTSGLRADRFARDGDPRSRERRREALVAALLSDRRGEPGHPRPRHGAADRLVEATREALGEHGAPTGA